MPLDLFEETRAVISVLDEEGIAYAICGGVALAIHGVIRATTDIDVLILPEDIDRALAAVESRGFDIPALPLEFSNGFKVRRITKLCDAESLVLDLIVVVPVLQSAFDGRLKMGSENGPVYVVSREGLIAMKSFAGREQDLADIKQLRELES